MKSKILKGLLMFVCSILVSGCVSQAVFDKHVADSDEWDKVLLCESRNDAYRDLLGSDEPNPTRRDEPNPTRRDELCQEEYEIIVSGDCKDDMITCVTPIADGGAGLPGPQCKACYNTCLPSGPWPALTCPLP